MHKRPSLICFMLVINWLPLPRRVIRTVATLSFGSNNLRQKNEEKWSHLMKKNACRISLYRIEANKGCNKGDSVSYGWWWWWGVITQMCVQAHCEESVKNASLIHCAVEPWVWNKSEDKAFCVVKLNKKKRFMCSIMLFAFISPPCIYSCLL